MTCLLIGTAVFGEARVAEAAKKISIDNVKVYQAIEADLNLTGSGTGYHAKMVFGTAESAVSFGVQYDQHGRPPYAGKAVVMVENVLSNAAGGQEYSWPNGIVVEQGKKYHMMMTLSKKGNITVYFDNKKLATYYNPGLAGKDDVGIRVEGSARKNGDVVNAKFTNIKVKQGIYDDLSDFTTLKFDTCPTIHSKVKKNQSSVTISGKLSGLGADQDWDSAYNVVSGVTQFYHQPED